jgi:hypothetical protein
MSTTEGGPAQAGDPVQAAIRRAQSHDLTLTFTFSFTGPPWTCVVHGGGHDDVTAGGMKKKDAKRDACELFLARVPEKAAPTATLDWSVYGDAWMRRRGIAIKLWDPAHLSTLSRDTVAVDTEGSDARIVQIADGHHVVILEFDAFTSSPVLEFLASCGTIYMFAARGDTERLGFTHRNIVDVQPPCGKGLKRIVGERLGAQFRKPPDDFYADWHWMRYAMDDEHIMYAATDAAATFKLGQQLKRRRLSQQA